MGKKSFQVHYQNKYPNGDVDATESKIDVYCSEGKHRVSLEKAGDGHWYDRSKENGASDGHCMSPIPKDSRYRKLHKNGNIGDAEEFAERKPKAENYAKANGGKVPSIAEIATSAEKSKK